MRLEAGSDGDGVDYTRNVGPRPASRPQLTKRPSWSIVARCRLLKVARSSLYWHPAAVSEDDLRLMRRIDELSGDAVPVCAIGEGVRVPGRGHGLVQPPGSRLEFVDRMDTGFCVEALQEALDRHGSPEIFNSDQGVQFTSAAFTGVLAASGVRISMDGKGRYLDNIFIERLWRSLKYEDIYIKAYASVPEARRGIGGWLSFYNDERLHQALGYRTPREVFQAPPVTHGYVDNASALTTSPQAHHQQQEQGFNRFRKSAILRCSRARVGGIGTGGSLLNLPGFLSRNGDHLNQRGLALE